MAVKLCLAENTYQSVTGKSQVQNWHTIIFPNHLHFQLEYVAACTYNNSYKISPTINCHAHFKSLEGQLKQVFQVFQFE